MNVVKAWISWKVPYNLKFTLHTFYSFRGLKFRCGLDSQLRAGFWKSYRAAVHAIRTIKYHLFQPCVPLGKNVKLQHQFQEIILSWVQSISFVVPHSLITALCFHRSRTLLSSTQKTAVVSQFPFSSAHRTTTHLNFVVYNMLLDFWCPSSITMVHDKLDHVLTTMAWTGFIQDCACLLRKACFTVPVWLIGSRCTIGFEHTEMSSIIQSVTLCARDWWRKGVG
jgi:hypothetical protein